MFAKCLLLSEWRKKIRVRTSEECVKVNAVVVRKKRMIKK